MRYPAIHTADLATLAYIALPIVVYFIVYLFDMLLKNPSNTSNTPNTSNTSKVHIFHFRGSDPDYEQIITGAYQLDFDKTELRFAGCRYRKRTKAYLQKLIAQLDPLSLDYLEKKERLEKEMHTQKSWKRQIYAEKAKTRLQKRPFKVDYSDLTTKENLSLPKQKEQLNSQDYRDLEKFMLKQFRFKGLYN